MKRLSMHDGVAQYAAPSISWHRIMDQMMSDFVTLDTSNPDSEPALLHVYLDDLIIIFNTSWEMSHYCRHVKLIAQRLKQNNNLKINAENVAYWNYWNWMGASRSPNIQLQKPSGSTTNKPNNPNYCYSEEYYHRQESIAMASRTPTSASLNGIQVRRTIHHQVRSGTRNSHISALFRLSPRRAATHRLNAGARSVSGYVVRTIGHDAFF